MNKLALIVQREYIRRITQKSFLLLTFLLPLLFVAPIFVSFWLTSIQRSDVRKIVIIDDTGIYAPLFENTDAYHFLYGEKSLEMYRADDNKEIFAFLSITADLAQHPNAARLYSKTQISNDLSAFINRILTKRIEEDKLNSFQIPGLKQMIEKSRVSFNIQTVKWDKDGNEHPSSTIAAHVVGFISTFIIYMFIMMYGAMVMQGVIEEKTSRIVEIMVSSVKPFELMLGKIIGIGFVGLTQMFAWGCLTSGILIAIGLIFPGFGQISDTTVATQAGGMAETSAMAWVAGLQSFNFIEIICYFIFYFAGGYLLYASIFAAIGSAVNTPEDTQQFMMPVTILLMFALYIGLYSIENPDGSVAFWCSLIPFTSSVVMIMRIPFDVPLWQKWLSVALLFTTAISIVYFAAKIYRVGILMYGKKPNLKEILKWITFR